ncbi:hypothetical protein D3C73_1101770 [compost metagenome]
MPAAAVPQAEIVNRMAARISGFLRPKRSAVQPEMAAPSTQPTSAELMAQPDWAGSVMAK